MKLVLASNILEHPAFARFVQSAVARVPDAAICVTGDLLNVFPEPGEDLQGSIFHEIYGGELIVSEMDRLVQQRFRDVETSRFLAPLRAMFGPTGAHYEGARRSAHARYRELLPLLSAAVGERALYFIPGNMDYPRLAEPLCASLPNLRMLDTEVIDLQGVTLGGLGGVPNTVHPFRGRAEISPYEMSEAEYARRLELLRGVDILLTHISPTECPALEDFLMTSPAKVLICRAPFDLTRASDFRGKLEVQHRKGKTVVLVRPFEYPVNTAVVVDLGEDLRSPTAYGVLEWSDSIMPASLPGFASAPLAQPLAPQHSLA